MKVPSTKVQNNFGKYIKYAEANEEIIVTRKGKEVARILPCEKNAYTLSEGATQYRTENTWVTYEEYLELVENSEQRFELIDGVIYNMSSPSYRHQHILMEISGVFYNWFRGKKCESLVSPFDITFVKEKNNTCVVQPDIMVICDKENLNKDNKYMGIPSLVVEVLSPSTRNKDLLKKLDLYMTCEVNEYWIVDPKAEIIDVYLFKDKIIDRPFTYKNGTDSHAVSEYFKGLEVNLKEVFA